jgi:hypothetical protein
LKFGTGQESTEQSSPTDSYSTRAIEDSRHCPFKFDSFIIDSRDKERVDAAVGQNRPDHGEGAPAQREAQAAERLLRHQQVQTLLSRLVVSSLLAVPSTGA